MSPLAFLPLVVEAAAVDMAAPLPLAALLPPARFQMDNTIIATFAKPELVQELCRKHGQERDPLLIGCADVLPPSMRAPNPCHFIDQSYARAVCHELGHANGWSYKHEE